MAMSNAMVVTPGTAAQIEYEQDGTIVRITSDDVRQRICRNANDGEIAYFLEMCRSQRLNPFTRDAYLVKYKDSPAQMVVSHKILLQRADRNPDYDGMESGVVIRSGGTISRREGSAHYGGEDLLGGWCKVYRKDRKVPVYAELSLAEYDKGQSLWKKMPGTMIVKCAQAAAIRVAFPSETAGLYSDAEMQRSRDGAHVDVETVETVETVDETVEVEVQQQPPVPSDADKAEMRSLMGSMVSAGYDAASSKNGIWQAYKAGGIEFARRYAYDALDEIEGEEDIDF